MTRLALAILAAFVAIAAPAGATTTTLDFDANNNGDVIATAGTATFVGNPTVFTPAHVATQSPPHALHKAAACPNTTSIGNDCGKQVVTFSTPASRVSLRVGLDDERGVFEFGTTAQLKAYNAVSGGSVVADSGKHGLDTQGNYVAITQLLTVQSAHTDIRRVELFVGIPSDNEYSRRVNLDDFTWTDDSLPPVAAPTIRIDAPAAGTLFARAADVHVSGQVSAPAGVIDFCVSTEATKPATCHDATMLDGSGRFTGLPVSGLHPGTNTIHVYASDGQAREATATVDVVLTSLNLRAANMEVTQAVQTELPTVPVDGVRSVAYNGVPLAAGKATFVRVWAGMTAASGAVDGVRMVLSATRGGTSLGAPITPVNGTRTIGLDAPTGTVISDALRSSPTSAYVFQLPPSWTTGGDIELTATINPSNYPSPISECEGCDADNGMTLTGIHFTPQRAETVTPVALITRDSHGRANPLADSSLAFYAASTVSPFPVLVRRYQATIDITAIANRGGCDADCKNGAAFDQVSRFDQETPNWNRQGHIVGINPGVARGLTAPVLFCCEPPRIDTNAVMDIGRPLTSVAHEFYHQLGFLHAGHDCPGDPGGFLGLQAEGWDPDHRGELHSFGFDPRFRSGGSDGVFAIEGTQDSAGAATQFFDLMSYCTNNYPETNSWISARNWTHALNDHATSGRAALRSVRPVAARAATGGPTIAVDALQVGKADPVVRVEPGLHGTVKPPAGKPDATIQLVDGAGDVVSKASTVALHGHVDEGPDVVSVGATVRDPGTAVRAEVRVDGKPFATIKRPAVTPKLRVLRPKVSKTSVLVRWRLLRGRAQSIAIDFATNGKRFRPVALLTRGRSYRVPMDVLAKGSKARFRVRISDGWNEGSAKSGRVKVPGPPVAAPAVALLGTPRVAVDGTLQLEATGGTDGDRPLPARAIAWYYGHRLLGRGRVVRISGLPAGRRSIRIVARGAERRIPVEVVRQLG